METTSVLSIKRVNPLYIKHLEQIHRVEGSPWASLVAPDLL